MVLPIIRMVGHLGPALVEPGQPDLARDALLGWVGWVEWVGGFGCQWRGECWTRPPSTHTRDFLLLFLSPYVPAGLGAPRRQRALCRTGFGRRRCLLVRGPGGGGRLSSSPLLRSLSWGWVGECRGKKGQVRLRMRRHLFFCLLVAYVRGRGWGGKGYVAACVLSK